jgi:hypothetical protein
VLFLYDARVVAYRGDAQVQASRPVRPVEAPRLRVIVV